MRQVNGAAGVLPEGGLGGKATAFIERPGAIRSDASYAIAATGLAPISRITRTRPAERGRGEENRRAARTRFSVCRV